MKIIQPTAKIINPDSYESATKMLLIIEEAARTCYKSEDKLSNKPNEEFIKSLIKKGHLSVIEHGFATVKVICDRGVSHELVRHRIASYSQESTRYCNYSKGKFGNELTFVMPYKIRRETAKFIIWYNAMKEIEQAYFDMLKHGATPQEARAVLPNSLKTEIVITMNFREWRHFLFTRLHPAAHPDMRIVAWLILLNLKDYFKIIFEDIYEQYKNEF